MHAHVGATTTSPFLLKTKKQTMSIVFDYLDKLAVGRVSAE
jgi:hypothetical protein